MKRIILLFALSLKLSASAQDCRFKQNGLDKFTGQITKQTKPEKVISGFTTEGNFSILKVDTNYSIIFDYGLATTDINEHFDIGQGSKIIFLLESGERVSLLSNVAIRGITAAVPGVPGMYTCNITNATYSISKNGVEILAKSKVKSIRYYRFANNGKEEAIDSDIKRRNQEDIMKLCNCVL